MMREAAQRFLVRNGWANGVVEPIAGDLSARQYFRVTQKGKSAILMDASGNADSLAPFCEMTEWLRGLGVSAPEILAADPEHSLLLIEDLGRQPVSAMLDEATNNEAALDAAIGLLLHIRKAQTPELPRPTPDELCEWTRLADSHYPRAQTKALDAIRRVLKAELMPLCAGPATVSLRDFHADNLMWLPDRRGVARLGVLDYQDAMLTHSVYDLVSLLTDARTEIPRDLRWRYIQRYAKASGDDPDDLALAFSVFSAQRNIRILGIFHRAAAVFDKTHHLPKVPRVYRYVQEAFEHPALAHLKDDLALALPQPEASA